MSTQDFLVELGTEELPPKALKSLAEAFQKGIEKGLKDAGLNYQTSHYYAAPRRLAVLVEALEEQQADRTINVDGPPIQAAFTAEGEPTQAALGFARKCGVELSAIDQSGAKLRFAQTIKGQATASLLPDIIRSALDNLPIPKRMRWAARREEFVRPTQWLVMLLGNQVIDCEILAQKAGCESRGHRFHNPAPVYISSPKSYVEDLRSAHVLADFTERKQLIADKVAELAKQNNGKAIVPNGLLEEVTALVEWPVPLVCSFEERFLEVPQEALISTMQDNQKYFCLLDEQGKLLPLFITVANVDSKDPSQVITGNEKVVRPRLTDAEFFFKQDLKQPLEQFNERLKNVVFQAKLGTVYDKAVRVSKLAGYVAEKLGTNVEQARRAGILSKTDLATEMVGEFPEMQGIAGYYYALAGGEAKDVALALNEQYMPRNMGGELPTTLVGCSVAIADKLDTLVGIFGIGMLPTGSKDPYALRRAALGILRILLEKRLELNLAEMVQRAVDLYGYQVEPKGLAEQVLDFIFDRLRARYEDEGINITTYQAVRALKPMSPLDFDQRVQAVEHFRKLPEAQALSFANKRVYSILEKTSQQEIATAINPVLLLEKQENALADAIKRLEESVPKLSAARDYSKALDQLASLQTLLDDFFEHVFVNVEDSQVRANRYALLARIRQLFLGIADISLLD
ncbi:glycine--tRNA ligase subunit beta [Entomomonas asaccharolytica]|uniref:Glycine--tRNA ligase beta subunit n=1 Tax=Entomomonas asaccharolytica TaxID=2785331 RepID=A0A974NF13_9GAMM|nr:glycine--tRNA ligase subunit beta [Entomomonas asaccharolytica]QQP85314.1 glycine--tRNA ligase subunit beta [Entomomonas asaccharolytica]